MPRRLAMSTLVTRCKQRADRENDEHISDSEWKALISETFGDLYQTVAGTGMRYFEATSDITATGAASYNEPADILSLVAVRLVVNATTGETRDLDEIMMQESSLWSGETGEAQAYAHVDDQIYLFPKPSSGTYRLAYIPQAPDLSAYADADLVDLVTADGEAFLVWGVALKALAKSQQDVQLAMAEREAARMRLTEWAVLKALNTPRRRPVVMMGDHYDAADWRFR